MDHSKQTLSLKLSESLGNGLCRQTQEHPGKIIVGHPNPITAIMKVFLTPPLFPVKIVKLNIHDSSGKTKPLDQFRRGRKILQNQASSMNELKRLRL